MNVLILGLGSIGQRHLRNFKKLDKKLKFFSLRRKYTTPLLNNKNVPQRGKIEKVYNIKNFKKFDDIKNIDIAIICTPSKFHVDEAIKLLKKNIHIFVEKPLGSSLKNVDKLRKLILQKPNIKSMMGYQLKFNPIILKLKNILENKTIGKIFNIFIHHGEHIDDFHPYENYNTSYAARKELGGGVILTQIHEIDYLLYLFKNYKFKVINSAPSKISKLNLNVEDNVVTNFELSKNKNDKAICTMHLNFYERPKKRTILIIGENGKIECDLNKGIIELFKKGSIQKFNFKFDRNKIFLNQIKYFLDNVKKDKKINKDYDLINGLKSLKLALKIK